jgi:hypothetical protein
LTGWLVTYRTKNAAEESYAFSSQWLNNSPTIHLQLTPGALQRLP